MAKLPDAKMLLTVKVPAVFAVLSERQRQDAKWGEQNHSDLVWLTVLSEEMGEAAQEILTQRNPKDGNGHGDLRGEVVQVAAVALAWLEAIDRRTDAAEN